MGLAKSILICHFLMALLVTMAMARPKVPSGMIRPNQGTPKEPKSNHPLNLVNLGEVDGKTYFVEYDNEMSWTDAKAYCEAANLTLATIETRNQTDFLDQALTEINPNMHYWTSLHESRRPSMLEWDGSNNRQPDTNVLPGWFWDTDLWPSPLEYCTFRQIFYGDNYMHVAYQRCEEPVKVLCQG